MGGGQSSVVVVPRVAKISVTLKGDTGGPNSHTGRPTEEAASDAAMRSVLKIARDSQFVKMWYKDQVWLLVLYLQPLRHSADCIACHLECPQIARLQKLQVSAKAKV